MYADSTRSEVLRAVVMSSAGNNAVQSVESHPKFGRKIAPPYSGSKNKPSRNLA
jgi:hypothetical protein